MHLFSFRVPPSSSCVLLLNGEKLLCIKEEHALYNIGNGLLVFVVQRYPPAFLSSLNFFDKSLSCSLSAFQKCNTQRFQPTTI